MELENLTLNYLQQEFAKAHTNGTFRLWLHTFLQRRYNLEIDAVGIVMNTLLND